MSENNQIPPITAPKTFHIEDGFNKATKPREGATILQSNADLQTEIDLALKTPAGEMVKSSNSIIHPQNKKTKTKDDVYVYGGKDGVLNALSKVQFTTPAVTSAQLKAELNLLKEPIRFKISLFNYQLSKTKDPTKQAQIKEKVAILTQALDELDVEYLQKMQEADKKNEAKDKREDQRLSQQETKIRSDITNGKTAIEKCKKLAPDKVKACSDKNKDALRANNKQLVSIATRKAGLHTTRDFSARLFQAAFSEKPQLRDIHSKFVRVLKAETAFADVTRNAKRLNPTELEKAKEKSKAAVAQSRQALPAVSKKLTIYFFAVAKYREAAEKLSTVQQSFNGYMDDSRHYGKNDISGRVLKNPRDIKTLQQSVVTGKRNLNVANSDMEKKFFDLTEEDKKIALGISPIPPPVDQREVDNLIKSFERIHDQYGTKDGISLNEMKARFYNLPKIAQKTIRTTHPNWFKQKVKKDRDSLVKPEVISLRQFEENYKSGKNNPAQWRALSEEDQNTFRRNNPTAFIQESI